MNGVLGFTILTLCIIGVVSALVLYFVAQKFKVEEDPRIDDVERMLPGANCGGCGFPGCRGLADKLVGSDDLSGLYCAVGGDPTMQRIAEYLGRTVAAQEPRVAVVRCSGSCELRPRANIYNGASSCAVEACLYGGETGCSYGCLGNGDCERACQFGAIHVNPATGLAEVDESKCTACGACVSACPKGLIELRKRGVKGRRIYVGCMNRDKGPVARKVCAVSCIGCGKCVKTCAFEAITMENHLAYIDSNKCRLCRKCVAECPQGSIREVGFPERKEVATPVAMPTSQTVVATPAAQA